MPLLLSLTPQNKGFLNSIMQLFIFALLSAIGALTIATAQKYTTKFDGVNLDRVLQNDRLLNSYINCVLERGKCTVDGLELKKNIPEALEQECGRCSEKQRQGAEKVLRFLYEHKPELFQELEAKFDPEGKFRAKYRERADELGVKV